MRGFDTKILSSLSSFKVEQTYFLWLAPLRVASQRMVFSGASNLPVAGNVPGAREHLI